MTLEINISPELGKAIPANPKESELLQQIKSSLDQIDWQRYQQLLKKRHAETLTPPEQNELIAFSDRLEAINIDRIDNLVKLAQIRNTTISHLMSQLGLKPITSTEALDQATQETVSLYHPRQQQWTDHFAWHENCSLMVGLTPTGRATIEKLQLNRSGLVNLRRILFAVNEHPPKLT